MGMVVYYIFNVNPEIVANGLVLRRY